MSYTNINNPFIIPSDGYITTTARNNDYTGMVQSIFVKKGMKAYVSDVNSGQKTSAIFSPMV